MSISVITSTNRQTNMNTILDNFLRQKHNPKELIILLNYDNPNDFIWKWLPKEYGNISVYTMSGKLSLGACLNYGISKAKFEYIAKLDDDDYYGEAYLSEALFSLQNVNADIVGKYSIYIYFYDEDILGVMHPKDNNKFVTRVSGSTLFFNKSITNIIKFKDKSLGEDLDFCKQAIKKNLKIYSTDRSQYVYIRSNKSNHTWKISNDYLIRECIKIGDKSNLEVLYNLWQD